MPPENLGRPPMPRHGLSRLEADYAKAIEFSLMILDDQVRKFEAGLDLFDFCFGREAAIKSKLPGKSAAEREGLEAHLRQTQSWYSVAARDAGMTLFHFAKALEGSKACARKSPTINGQLDWDQLRQATRKFQITFPKYEALRHAIAHAGEMASPPKELESNMIKGSVDRLGIKADDKASLLISAFDRREYVTTIDGVLVGYELSLASLVALKEVRDEIFQQFWKPSCHLRALPVSLEALAEKYGHPTRT